MSEEDQMKSQEEWADDPPPSWLSIPPGVDELIVDDGEPMESGRHRDAMNLLIEPLYVNWADRKDFFAGGNMFLYFSMTQWKKNDFRGPDVFVVLGTERKERKAWVQWEEDGKRPTVIIELTSPATVAEDRGRKKQIYERTLEIPYYVMADPFSGDVEALRLPAPGAAYEPISPSAAGRFPIEPMELELGIWRGVHRDADAPWLRWYAPDGALLLTGEERFHQERARADREAQRVAELERRLQALEREAGPKPK